MIVAISDCPSGRFLPGTRVMLDGKDVSRECFRAVVFSNGSGVVRLYSRNEKGQFYLNAAGDEPASVERTGKVEIIPPEHITAEVWAGLMGQWVMAER